MKKILPITNGLRGELKIPGDKSISHRSIILSSLGTTPVEITNFLAGGADCLSTIACMRALGAKIEQFGEKILVTGRGLHGLSEPEDILDAGNSGTTLRLLMGLLSAQKFLSTFTGDNSLRKRPMARVIKPLIEMGASIFGRKNNQNLPITIIPTKKLRGIVYEMPIASAQVKSAILLAGLFAEGATTVIEPAFSRDHTEKMLSAFGAQLERAGKAIKIYPAEEFFAPKSIFVPGDISSAAYWLVLATILHDSDVILRNVGVNETRTGILDVLKRMGARIELLNERISGGERAADVRIVSSKLRGVEIGGEIIPRLIDEIPALAVAAAFAEGTTIIRDAGELRVKESDRLAAIVDEFSKIAPNSFSATENSLIIRGGGEKIFANCKTRADHRMAMSLAIFGAAAKGLTLDDADCVKISYPNFFDALKVD